MSTLAATSAEHFDVSRRTVNFADLDVSRSAGAAVLYSRIRSAARDVCEPAIARESMSRTIRCMDAAIARAVADVNAPALTSYHLAKTNRT